MNTPVFECPNCSCKFTIETCPSYYKDGKHIYSKAKCPNCETSLILKKVKGG